MCLDPTGHRPGGSLSRRGGWRLKPCSWGRYRQPYSTYEPPNSFGEQRRGHGLVFPEHVRFRPFGNTEQLRAALPHRRLLRPRPYTRLSKWIERRPCCAHAPTPAGSCPPPLERSPPGHASLPGGASPDSLECKLSAPESSRVQCGRRNTLPTARASGLALRGWPLVTQQSHQIQQQSALPNTARLPSTAATRTRGEAQPTRGSARLTLGGTGNASSGCACSRVVDAARDG